MIITDLSGAVAGEVFLNFMKIPGTTNAVCQQPLVHPSMATIGYSEAEGVAALFQH